MEVNLTPVGKWGIFDQDIQDFQDSTARISGASSFPLKRNRNFRAVFLRG
jgi:hypothetical protein